MPATQTTPVSSTLRYEVTGPDGVVVTVLNLGPDSCYYAAASTVSSGSNDGTLASGSSLSFTPSKFFISAGLSRLQVTTPSERQALPPVAELKRAAMQPVQAAWGTAIDSTLERGRANSNGIVIGTTGKLTLLGVVMIPAGRTVTNITVMSGSTAMVTPANQHFSLVDTAAGNAILAKTIDNTTTAWGTVTPRTLALSTPYTPTVNTLAYIGMIITAATMPSVEGWTGVSNDLGLVPVLAGTTPGPFTDPASFTAVGTITASGVVGFAWIA